MMQNNIPFLKLRDSYIELKSEIDEAVMRVLDSGYYLLGKELLAFESEYASYCEAQHCIGVGNGLEALELALRALEVGPGDEVIVPSNTYIATWLAVSAVGATIVPVEPDPGTCNIDPLHIEAAITPSTKVILPVHLYGQPADMDPITEIAEKHGIYTLEDAAQAHGARYKGRRVGSLGHVTAWSFYPTKNLGAFGDSGAVTTNDPEIADKVRLIRNYGARTKYVNEVKGTNSRMEELHAAMLRVKLAHLDEWNGRRKTQAALYLEQFADCGLRLQEVPEWADSVWHIFTVRTPARDALQQRLDEFGVGTLIHYPIPPHLQSAYSELGYGEGAFPLSEAVHKSILSLPIGPHVTDSQVDDIIVAVKTAASELKLT